MKFVWVKENEGEAVESGESNGEIKRVAKLHTKTGMFAALIVLLLFFSILFLYMGTKRASEKSINTMKRSLNMSFFVEGTYDRREEIVSTAIRYLMSGANEDYNSFKTILRENTEKLHQSREDVKILEPTQEEMNKFQELGVYGQEVTDQITSIVESKHSSGQSGNFDEQQKAEFRKYMDLREKYDQFYMEFNQYIFERSDMQITNSVKKENIMYMIVFFMLIITGTQLLFLMRSYRISVFEPMNRIKDDLERMSRGDLKGKIDVQEDTSEVGMMVVSINKMKHFLNTYIKDIDEKLASIANGDLTNDITLEYIGDFHKMQDSYNKILESLNNMMGDVLVIGDQVGSGADQVAAGAQELSQGATEQASSIEELSARLNEIAIGQQELMTSFDNLQAGSDSAGTELQKTHQKVEEMERAILDIENKSQEISKIMKSIDDIAFQTNILALNAAVEAARAGEAGKGFAVVADEVRNLASRSAVAAQSTATLTEETERAVSIGVEVSRSVKESIVSTVELALGATTATQEARKNAQTQVDAVFEINRGVEQISSVVQTNSATAEQSAASSEELANQVQVMKQSLERFKTKRQIAKPYSDFPSKDFSAKEVRSESYEQMPIFETQDTYVLDFGEDKY